jgi:hypothetical protein
MTLSVQATFATETPAKGPAQIGLRGLLAGKSLAEMRPYKGSGYDHMGLVADPVVVPEIAKPKKEYPVESYYLNGAQYLTGGVGNRLSFH